MPASLIWPDEAAANRAKAAPRAPDSTPSDLGLDELVHALCLQAAYADRVRGILLTACDDVRVIGFRQDVLDDLLANEALCDGLRTMLAPLSQLGFVGNPGRPNEPPLNQVLFRLGELELYVDCVARLHAMLSAHEERLRSAGLRGLLDYVGELQQDAAFQSLAAELPAMLDKVRNVSSVTVGINLDHQLQPAEATLLAINAFKFKGGGSLLDRLFGTGAANADEQKGKLGLHRINLPDGMAVTRENLMLVPLFRDLSRLLEDVAKPIAEGLMRFTRISGKSLIALDAEISFYLGATRMIRRVRELGLPMCKPDIADANERTFQLRDGYNLTLALRAPHNATSIVANDIAFDDDARIFILTGPNRGGKTTYIQAIGQAQLLAQAGLFVPAAHARISPVDGVFTHFAAEEKPHEEAGRLGEEARRLNEIFARATRRSLILLNESLASTSAGESLYLSRDVVRALRLLGARAVFGTHLHPLADDADAINAQTPGESRVASLIAESLPSADGQSGQRTFKIKPGPPQGMSYARDIARQFGIGFDQLEQLVRRRGAAGGDERS